ncbi:MAG: 3-keto-disaccharide hydrolase [Chitinophagaceae bacterium]
MQIRKVLPRMGSLVMVFLVLPFLSRGQAENRLTSKEKKQGWHLLFDGHDLRGWHTYMKHSVVPAWSVKNGEIILQHAPGEGGGDLVTDQEYQNFDLKLVWKISNGGNSGIIFDVHESPQYSATYETGPEMQILDNLHADDNKKDSHLAGSLYDLIPADPSVVHPAEEWNHIRIRLNHGHLRFWMNGKQVVDTRMWDAKWNKLVAGSKFLTMKGFAKYRKGHIALQDHGDTVTFRQIKIRRL